MVVSRDAVLDPELMRSRESAVLAWRNFTELTNSHVRLISNVVADNLR